MKKKKLFYGYFAIDFRWIFFQQHHVLVNELLQNGPLLSQNVVLL